MKEETRHSYRSKRLKKYHEQTLCQQINLDEMDKFLKKIKITKLIQEERENVNRCTSSTGVELVIQKLTKEKPRYLPGELGIWQFLKIKNLKNTKCSQTLKKKKREHLQTHFIRPVLTPISKPDKDIQGKKKPQTGISYKY